MSRAVLWSPTAKAELEEIARYVARTSPVYAERLVDRILGPGLVTLEKHIGGFVAGVALIFLLGGRRASARRG